jgi:hypothetical protein
MALWQWIQRGWRAFREGVQMTRAQFWQRLPGMIGFAVLMLPVMMWTLWSLGEMFYEGWWGPWYVRAAYLIPMAIFLLMLAAAIQWPRIGGAVLVIFGVGFSLWWWPMLFRRAGGAMSVGSFLSFFLISGVLVLPGILLFWEGRRLARLRRDPDWQPPAQTWVRNARWIIGLGLPLIIAVSVIAANLPRVLFRVDRGDYAAVLIEGNDIALVWAPAGPGWSRGAGPFPEGEDPLVQYPGWDTIAFYGVYGLDSQARPRDQHATQEDMAQTGLCRYLSADGTQLMADPQDIWRMPTMDELVRSLVWRGENAGCTWDGDRHGITCDLPSDKDWPLWATNWSPVYYWSGDSYNEEEAWYVSSSGSCSYQPKGWGNSRHGFRCVRDPDPALDGDDPA